MTRYELTDDSKKLLRSLFADIDSPDCDYVEMVYCSALEQASRVLKTTDVSGLELSSIRRIQDELARHIIHQMDIAYCWQNQYSEI